MLFTLKPVKGRLLCTGDALLRRHNVRVYADGSFTWKGRSYVRTCRELAWLGWLTAPAGPWFFWYKFRYALERAEGAILTWLFDHGILEEKREWECLDWQWRWLPAAIREAWRSRRTTK
jgi:hypothetical protein